MQSTSFHENLHALGYGQNPDNEFFIKFIADPEKTKRMSQKSKDYFLSTFEAPVHSVQLGRNWGLSYGQNYPGDDIFLELKSKHGIGGAPYYFKLNNHTDYRRFWNAITGTYFKY